ncbi:MAG: hypothetical protein DSY80_07800 [Desulfocapsa sp.]|nr:MAG: hypothetical protein DSY80_07800 [Desulfocapsa sp.]
MAKHTLTIVMDIDIYNSPERPRAGQAFINQIGHRIADGMLPRAIQQYVRDSGATITLNDNEVENVTVAITIAES